MVIENCFVAQNISTAEQHAEGISGDFGSNVVIRFNQFCDLEGTAVIALITQAAGAAENWEVYGNVVWHTGTWGANLSGLIAAFWDSSNATTAKNWLIYNNTFATIRGIASVVFQSPYTANVGVYNNLFWQNRTNVAYVNYVYIAGATYDYNYYAACAHPGTFVNAAHEPAITPGPNCSLSAIPAAPLFVDSALADFRLAAPLQGFPGVRLPSFNDRDMLGNLRSAGPAWDRGAYEYEYNPYGSNPVISVSPDQLEFGAAPAGLTLTNRVTVRNIGNGILAGTASVTGPFSILGGGSYSLGPNQSQVVQVGYHPTTTGVVTQMLTFAGGGGAKTRLRGLGAISP